MLFKWTGLKQDGETKMIPNQSKEQHHTSSVCVCGGGTTVAAEPTHKIRLNLVRAGEEEIIQ